MNGAAYSSFHRVVFRCLLDTRESNIIDNGLMLFDRTEQVTTPQLVTYQSQIRYENGDSASNKFGLNIK